MDGINQRMFKLLNDKKALEKALEKEQKRKVMLLTQYESLLTRIANIDINDKEKLKNLQHDAFKTLDLIEITRDSRRKEYDDF